MLSRVICALVWTQAATFVFLGAAKFLDGDWRLGATQLCLAAVTALVYL